MKLALQHDKTINGRDPNIFHCNLNGGLKGTSDLRQSIIAKLNNFVRERKLVIMAKFTDGGYLLAIIKDTGSTQRPDDNKTSWIYVPAKASITGLELVDVIDCVKDNLLGLEENCDEVEKKFTKDYKEKDLLSTAVATIKSTSNGNLAWRKYGKGTRYQLSDLLGNAIAQKEYGNYEAVCFVDAESGVTVNGEELTDELKPIVTVQPYKEDGWALYIKLNGSELSFDKALELPEGTEISVVWKKSGYRDVSYTHTVSKDDDDKPLTVIAIKDEDKKIILYRSVFDVIDEDGKPVTGCEMKVNGKPFWNDKMEILEADLKKEIQIEVTMKGYNPYKKQLRINDARQIPIKLEKHEEESTYTLPKEEGEGLSDDATITIKLKGVDKKMPLKGYIVEGNKNNQPKLIWDPFALKVQWFLTGFASVFVAALVIVVMVVICDSIESFISTHDFKFGWPPIKEKSTYTIRENVGDEDEGGNQGGDTSEVATDSDVTDSTPDDSIMEATVVYLNNAKWHKDSLENYPLTKGLFDNMRNFNIDNVISILEQSSIDTVDNVKKVIEAANECKSSGRDPSKGGKFKYPQGDIDKEITVETYVTKLGE